MSYIQKEDRMKHTEWVGGARSIHFRLAGWSMYKTNYKSAACILASVYRMDDSLFIVGCVAILSFTVRCQSEYA